MAIPRRSFEERLKQCDHPLLKKLFKIMIDKKTNLCVAADFRSKEEILRLADLVGKHICILKLHIDFIPNDEIKDAMECLYQKKKEHNFLLFEDQKYNDGENTVELSASRHLRYNDLVTVDSANGEEVFKGIEAAIKLADLPENEPRGCLAVCERSFAGRIPCDPLELLKDAEAYPNICVGIIAQGLQVSDDTKMIKATPGVHMDLTTDSKNQQWRNPAEVMAGGTDIIIVGRGITAAPESEWENKTHQYKQISWQGYLDSIVK